MHKMRICIFGDVHGNRYALDAVWDSMKGEGCDFHVFLGDVSGYYCYDDDTIDFFRQEESVVSIMGNHDDMLLQSLEDSKVEAEYAEKYGLSHRYLKESISPENIGYLRSLPSSRTIGEHDLAFFHGSPWDALNEYVYPDSDMRRFDGLPFKAVFLGHTHYPMDIRRRGIRILNPGSAGQPRDKKWASYGVYDLRNESFDIKRVAFDRESLIKDVRTKNERNPYLIDVLERISG